MSAAYAGNKLCGVDHIKWLYSDVYIANSLITAENRKASRLVLGLLGVVFLVLTSDWLP
jgi:hypothetical protein